MPSDLLREQRHAKIWRASDLPLEVIVLILFGSFYLLFGLLLFKIYSGELPYSPDSALGLFMVLCSFQMITMGKTPFGDLRRSWALVILGMGTAGLGIAAAFIPGYFTDFVRVLVGIILLAGGTVLFIQLGVSERKARMWIKIPGILRQLTVACAVVYGLTIVSGLITLSSSLSRNPRTAFVLTFYGTSLFYLAYCLRKVLRKYNADKTDETASTIPSSDKLDSQARFILFKEAPLPLPLAILILSGFLVTLLGLLLFPVGLGMLSFSPDGQLGLTLTIMAIQMMTLGDTPLGQYTRSWAMIVVGIVVAGLGVVSCIVPGMLTGMIQTLLGLLNILGGSAFFIRRLISKHLGIGHAEANRVDLPPIVRRLERTQIVLNSLMIAFGISMLLPGLVSVLVVACILVINGPILFILASLLRKLAIIGTPCQPQIVL